VNDASEVSIRAGNGENQRIFHNGRNYMRQYSMKETKEVSKIICNKCGREIQAANGRLQEDVLSVDKRWGYFSEKDNQVDSFDLCEKCYDEFVATFLLPARK